MGSALPDIACHKGRQRVADDEDRHNGPPLREQRPCACSPTLNAFALFSMVKTKLITSIHCSY